MVSDKGGKQMRRSPNPLVTLRQCHKCGAIDSGLDLTVERSYEVTADSCEKCEPIGYYHMRKQEECK